MEKHYHYCPDTSICGTDGLVDMQEAVFVVYGEWVNLELVSAWHLVL
jgi:hypothetical protein